MQVDGSKLNTLSQFVADGWALIPLHDVSAGMCSCTLAGQCRSAGKHPRNRAWQSGGWVRDAATLASVVRDRPGWNWGAVTGTPSGMWVLDVDPDNGGMESLAALAEVCGTSATLGAHRVHRTGSGGLHLVYAIGDDGWMPRTTVGRAHTLGPGLDIRAEGGQVVLPSSASGKGAYVVELDRGLQVAGATLREEIERRLAPVDSRESMAIRPQDLVQGSATEGGERYARAVVEACIVEMREAPVGTRNDTGFRTAVRIWEMVLAPWNSLGETDVLDEWWAAAGITGAPTGELQGLWTRAYGRASEGERAVLPASAVGGESVPFDGGPAGTGPDAPFDPMAWRADQPAAVDPVVAAMRQKILPRSRFGTIKRPTYLIEDTLNLASDTWLIGASGSYKSFVALGWACHVATGKPWHGRRVRQGKVLIIVAEGSSGIEQRVAAWERLNGTTVGDDLMMLPESVYASSGVARGTFLDRVSAGWWALQAIVAEERPALILLDTQARMATGLNENDNSDMAFWTECVASLRGVSGACVLVVHHTGRKGGDARGGSAIDAAQDMEWTVVREGSEGSEGSVRQAKLVMTKNKDAADRIEHLLALDVVELGEDDEGKPITSLGVRVVVPAEGGGGGAGVEMGGVVVREAEDRPMTDSERYTLALWKVIYNGFNHGNGATWSVILSNFQCLPEMSRFTVKQATNYANLSKAHLVALGLLLKADRGASLRVVEVSNGKYGRLTPSASMAGWMPEDGWQIVPRTVGQLPAWARDRIAEYGDSP